MSNKSGTSSQAVALPQGGGALSGIGETFSPDLFTGTGNLTVPLDLPSGRNGFQPVLSLGYSTGTGNGPFGLGWKLSIPGVSRKTAKGIPRYRDDATGTEEQDVFVLAGAEDLVPVAQPAPGVTRFQPRTEGLFARIERTRAPGRDSWRVAGRDGIVSLYGEPATTSDDPPVVADPTAPDRIFAWQLSETLDPFGNRIEYRYLRDRATERSQSWDQLYPQEIRYVDFQRQGQARFLISVTFVYEERPDPFSDHRAGFEIRTRLRCTGIEVRTHADRDVLARTYRLVYLDTRVGTGELDPSVLPPNGVSLLSQVRVVGHDGDSTQELPPLELGYTRFEPQRQRFQPIRAAAGAMPSRSLADDGLEMVSLFANGLPDIVQMNGTARFWRNLGAGRFDAAQPMDEVPAGIRLRDPGVRLADMNGDGRADLLVLDRNGYFPLRFGGRWNPQDFVRYTDSPSVAFGDNELRLIDLDGDGVTDALRTGSSFELFRNDPNRGWGLPETRPRGPIEEFPDLSFSNPRVKLADMTGDGLQDFVLVDQRRIDYWPYLGHGRWGRRVTMAGSPFFQDAVPLPGGAFEPRRVLFGDLDGDGLDDVVYVQPGRLTLWINRGGQRWSDPVTIAPTPAFPDPDAVRLEDVLGTGLHGVLWSSDQAGPADHYQFLELTGGIKPYVLDRVDNNMGMLTRIEYGSSTEFYRSDLQDPRTRWKTPLPFPVQVVKRVEVIDQVSRGKLTTEYRYHHGYWDGAERELRGFGLVEQLDTETFERFNRPGLHGEGEAFLPVQPERFSPPTLTRTWFHLGDTGDELRQREEADLSGEHWPGDPSALQRPADTTQLLESLSGPARAAALRALQGFVLRTELYALDGTTRQDRPFTVTESQYGLREEAPPEPGRSRQHIFFPHLSAKRVTQWDRGNEPMTEVTFVDDYDRYGQPRTRIAVAVPRRRDFRVPARPGDPYLVVLTRTDHGQRDTDRVYMVDRIARITSFQITNDGSPRLSDLRAAILNGSAPRELIGQTLNFYDGPAFVGGPLGDPGDLGALVRTERLILTEELLRGAHGEIPSYLVPGSPAPSPDHPREFSLGLPPLAGYIFHPGGDGRERGYFAATVSQGYDFQDSPQGRGHGLVTAVRDPLGHETRTSYDRFGLLPAAVVDPVGLSVTIEHDYRVMQPRLVTDPNGNTTEYRFTPLGLLRETFARGRAGVDEGDRRRAGARFEYEFGAFAGSPPDRRRPVSVRAIRREHHDTETDVPPAAREGTIETVDYSDGFGRLIQSRTQAEDDIFGDADLADPLFGADVLTASQEADARVPVSGRARGPGAAPNVVVSGWQTFDNKGQVVERFEPFYSRGFGYLSPEDERALTGRDVLGQKGSVFYDARGQVLRTVDPDGSEQRVVYGVPGTISRPDPSSPDTFEPTPWEAYIYDASDNANRTHPSDPKTARYRHHHDTPSSIVVDALGRTVQSVERNRTAPSQPDGPLPPLEELRTSTVYDVRGNVVATTDALGRMVSRHIYDLANNPLRTDSADAGVRRIVLDAAGNEIERRDSKEALVLQAYDALNRPLRLWARNDARSPVTLRELLQYGDGSNRNQPSAERAVNRSANRLGKLHRHHDEAGLTINEAYDLNGNVLERVRRVIGDTEILGVPDAPDPDGKPVAYRVDWQPPPNTTLADRERELLDPAEYRTSTTFDALSRPKVLLHPQDQAGQRKTLRPRYNRAGALERVQLDGDAVVERLAYNAKGQRTLAALGNGVLLRCAYDPQTFRLVRLRSERSSHPGPLDYRPSGAVLQDVAYEYDLAGNVLAIHDRAPGSGVPAQPDRLDRTFGYDAVYRLTSATGREHAAGTRFPWQDRVGTGDITLARLYTETYQYDRAGNVTQLRHTAQSPGNAGGFTRRFALAGGTNRLRSLAVGNGTGMPPLEYRYDDNGNLLAEGGSRRFGWDHSDQMAAFRSQPGTAEEPSLHAHYLYDTGGMRVKKLIRRQGGGFSSTVYVDDQFEHHRWGLAQGSGLQVQGENTVVHVMDEQQRVAIVRTGPAHPDDRGPAVQYHLTDHVGSSTVVVGGGEPSGSEFVNREEYTPYGETAFGSFGRKRYRFSGRERDEESGLSYHRLRYLAPWTARWTSCDPLFVFAGGSTLPVGDQNPFSAFAGNPLHFVDPSGLQPERSNLDPKESFRGRLSVLMQQGWRFATDDEGKPVEFQAPEHAGSHVEVGGSRWEYRKSLLLVHSQQLDPVDNQPAELTYHVFEETEPGLLQKALEAITPVLEWASLIPVVGDFVDLAMPAIYAAQGRHEDAALAAAAVAVPGLSIGIIKKSGLGEKAVKLLGKSADEASALTKLSKTEAKSIVEPDVYSIELVRWKKEAKAGSRGVTEADRIKAREIADRLGHKGPVDVGHDIATPHVFTKPGDPIWLRATPRRKNRQGGPVLRKEAGRIRKSPWLNIYVRPKKK